MKRNETSRPPTGRPTTRRGRRAATKRRGRQRRQHVRRPTRWLLRAALGLCAAVGVYLAICTLLLVAYRSFDPPTTGVQLQRRIESWFSEASYRKRYRPLPASRISPYLRHAVVAAEDSRFFEHGGIDWRAVEHAIEDTQRGRPRGGSTISQQLAKNLFLTTHGGWARKALEVPLTYLTETVLGKDRILTLYLNVVEWGPGGVFGAEAAARYHYGVSAASLDREQAARLAACLPAPRRWSPRSMDRYSAIIEERMARMGW